MGEILTRRVRRWRHACVFLGASLLLYFLLLVFTVLRGDGTTSNSFKATGRHRRPSRGVFDTLNLSEEQCNVTFPGLTDDIDRTIARGPFTLKQTTGALGPLQARIKDGQLYIVNWEKKLSPELIDSRMASLHQIHRALLTAPSLLPDTVFSLNIQDQPFGTAWSYARPAFPAPAASLPHINRAFLMPHFSFWSWPLPFVGVFARAAAAVDALEASLPFAKKDPRAVWRGTARFNGAHYPRLRQRLLKVAQGKDWADVQPLSRGQNVSADIDPDVAPGGYGSATNSLLVEDFCRYKYILHTEGITYSGRFQFLQMCGSVLITPPIAWLQHTTHLVRPLFSDDLDLGSGPGTESWIPDPDIVKAWPTRYRPEEANIVFVSPEWTDLEGTVRWLEEHPQVAEGIARRQRELFVGGGYLSPAAETCYWRALVRGWNKVASLEGEGWEEKEGMRWELFSMRHEGRE